MLCLEFANVHFTLKRYLVTETLLELWLIVSSINRELVIDDFLHNRTIRNNVVMLEVFLVIELVVKEKHYYY